MIINSMRVCSACIRIYIQIGLLVNRWGQSTSMEIGASTLKHEINSLETNKLNAKNILVYIK